MNVWRDDSGKLLMIRDNACKGPTPESEMYQAHRVLFTFARRPHFFFYLCTGTSVFDSECNMDKKSFLPCQWQHCQGHDL